MFNSMGGPRDVYVRDLALEVFTNKDEMDSCPAENPIPDGDGTDYACPFALREAPNQCDGPQPSDTHGFI